VETYRHLYREVLLASEEMGVLANSASAALDFKVLDYAHVSPAASSDMPDWLIVLSAAIPIGIGTAFALALFVEYWRDPIKGPGDLWRHKIEVMGVVPRGLLTPARSERRLSRRVADPLRSSARSWRVPWSVRHALIGSPAAHRSPGGRSPGSVGWPGTPCSRGRCYVRRHRLFPRSWGQHDPNTVNQDDPGGGGLLRVRWPEEPAPDRRYYLNNRLFIYGDAVAVRPPAWFRSPVVGVGAGSARPDARHRERMGSGRLVFIEPFARLLTLGDAPRARHRVVDALAGRRWRVLRPGG
jgi:hypothetical protein